MDSIVIICLAAAICVGIGLLYSAMNHRGAPEKPMDIDEKHSTALAEAVKRIAWGYLLIYLNVNLGTLNVLPNWLGYCFFLWALPVIAKEESSAALLRPLGMLLAVWEGVLWAAAAFGTQLDSYLLTTIAAALSLYFHFQLLTNLANIAARYGCPQEKRIRVLRTVQTVGITLLALPIPWQEYEALAVLMVVVQVLVALWICGVLFSLRKSLDPVPEE